MGQDCIMQLPTARWMSGEKGDSAEGRGGEGGGEGRGEGDAPGELGNLETDTRQKRGEAAIWEKTRGHKMREGPVRQRCARTEAASTGEPETGSRGRDGSVGVPGGYFIVTAPRGVSRTSASCSLIMRLCTPSTHRPGTGRRGGLCSRGRV